MAYQKWKATRLHLGTHWAGQDSVLITDYEGTVTAVTAAADAGDDVQVLEGVLVPGLVNAHCHIELSHLKGHIPPHTGMVDFLLQVVQLRRFTPDEIHKAAMAAIAEMRANGIVAVGDICNTTDSLQAKLQSDIYFHNFIEVPGFVPGAAAQRWQQGLQVADAFTKAFAPQQVTLTPHAPYSLSLPLLQMFSRHAPQKTLSLHLMESEDELAFFKEKQGDFNRLFAQLGIRTDFFEGTGLNPLQYLWPSLKSHYPWLWVHNTELSLHDLQWLDMQGVSWPQVYFCLCPGANQYINFATPAVHRFRTQYPLQLCLGTDSLAGNHYLNMLYEMRLLQKHGRLNDLEYLLQMATLQGARALQISDRFGSFEKGKKPGLVLISGLEGDLITPKTKATRLL